MRLVELRTEVTGTVWKIETRVGERVAEGDTLMVFESMKMEIPLIAPEAGCVAEILTNENEAVAEGQIVLVLAT